jgi:two-component system sensor histidine kinase KdpD
MTATGSDASRPSPEQLLKDARRAGRGRLKVFLGAAPGVGKTYAMLRAAQRAKADGVDVCVGLIETHGRAETEAQLAGLEHLPRARIEYRGRWLEELDVDGILKRRPGLVLVDEFAHSNVPGSNHPKRYQDVEDLLSAGLDVWTTLNVQHLDSLNDVVARVTGVAVRETIPDEVLDGADEIELIDLPPEELIRRLKDGKVYVPEQARQALNQFFGRGALTALRELALRAAAEHIDAEMLEFKARHAVSQTWPTRERLLVCVNEQDITQTVIRTARRIAEHRRIPWIAVHIETPRALSLSDAAKTRVEQNLRLAQRLGAETLSAPGTDLIATLLELARARNATQIVVGRPQPHAWRWPWAKSVATELIRRAAPIDVTVVTWVGTAQPSAARWPALTLPKLQPWRSYVAAAALSVVAALVALVLDRFVGLLSLGVVFLLAVLLVAVRRGLGPALFASVLCSALYNFLFTEPKFTLLVHDPDDFAALLSFFVAALLAGNVGGRLRQQLEATKQSAREALELSEFSQRLAAAAEIREVVQATVNHLRAMLDTEAVIMRPDAEGTLIVEGGSNNQRPLQAVDHAAAKWAYDHDEAAGCSTDTLPASGWRFLSLVTARGRIGVVGAHFAGRGRDPDARERGRFDAVADLAAIAIERTQLASDLEQSRVLVESEQLRAALLSSLSHDLRTPLVSVLGAAESLLSEGERLEAPARSELAASILDEAERLNRFVQNLLDMTRLSYGALRPKLDWCEVRDLLAGARKRLTRVLDGRPVSFEVPADFPLLRVDAVLMEQVLVNLLDNAAKYSPAGAPISVECDAVGQQLSICIRDRGSGIAPADRERVFDMFYRARAGDSRTAGTGLGLAICRGLLQAHGGSIRALANPDGVGSCLEILLPRIEAETAA